MTTKTVARCAIYEDRPKVCRDYPQIDHYIPEECTYTFMGGDRRGGCECDLGICCAIPRENGEPGGTPLPELAGGAPCKHLKWETIEVEPTKTASVLPIIQDSPVNRSRALEEAVEGES
jgi:hypothetical protein